MRYSIPFLMLSVLGGVQYHSHDHMDSSPPVHHGLADAFADREPSSWGSVLSSDPIL